MFVLEVFDGTEWEHIPDIFDSAEDAELYYHHQLGGFCAMRVTELVD